MSFDVESGRVPRYTVVHVDVPGVSALGPADAARSLSEARMDVLRRQRVGRRQSLPQPGRRPCATVVLHQRSGRRLGVLHHPSLWYVASDVSSTQTVGGATLGRHKCGEQRL